MKLKIIRIEDEIVTCELNDGGLIDVAQRWFDNKIKVNDIIDVDITRVIEMSYEKS